MGANAATLPFVIDSTPPTDSDPYLSPQPKGKGDPRFGYILAPKNPERLPRPDKTKLLYQVNWLIYVHHLCIYPSMTPDILAIVHGESHPEFFHCYEIIARSWLLHNLTKLLHSFIHHCPQCLALQTRWHPLYGSLQPINSSPVLFFTPTLDFMLVLPLSEKGFNAIISVTCKFSKRVTLVEGADTWSAEQWTHVFLSRFDLID